MAPRASVAAGLLNASAIRLFGKGGREQSLSVVVLRLKGAAHRYAEPATASASDPKKPVRV
jgi:hypothetical protein